MTPNQRRKLIETLMQATLDLKTPGFGDDAETVGAITVMATLGCALDHREADNLARHCLPWLQARETEESTGRANLAHGPTDS